MKEASERPEGGSDLGIPVIPVPNVSFLSNLVPAAGVLYLRSVSEIRRLRG